jgi:hypothetical protein
MGKLKKFFFQCTFLSSIFLGLEWLNPTIGGKTADYYISTHIRSLVSTAIDYEKRVSSRLHFRAGFSQSIHISLNKRKNGDIRDTISIQLSPKSLDLNPI